MQQIPAQDDWDPAQLGVVQAGSDRRVIVQAGPGTGKTAVACARLAYLINEGSLTAANVWMVSFTRAAVAEIRTRLESYLGRTAFSVKVATVDSYAWGMHSGYVPDAKLTGSYESNIETVIDLIASDESVSAELARIEHLVIDEAQDLLGVRADLLMLLISKLNKECGVTVFADSAQAIYGFAEDSSVTTEEMGSSLVDQLTSSDGTFEEMPLETVHRTESAGLKKIFREVRKTVLDGIEDPVGLFSIIRERIAEHADESGLKSTEVKVDDVPANSLVLLRSRAEALRYSQFSTKTHSLRLSGYRPHIPAWIAAIFFDFKEPAISEAGFQELWFDRVENILIPEYGPQDAWSRLMRVAGSRDGSVSLKRLRARLARQNLPTELSEHDFGLPGPIVGTIHASKGREADEVMMLMPRDQEHEDPLAEAEEARIIFVGATRARSLLKVGTAARFSGAKLESGRAFKLAGKGKMAAMIEFGREGDVCLEGLTSRKFFTDKDFRASQDFLLKHASSKAALLLSAEGNFDWRYKLMEPDSDRLLGILHEGVNNDVWSVAKMISTRESKKLRPNLNIKHIHMLGARTLVVPEDAPEIETMTTAARERAFLLAPMIVAFTNVYFTTYR